MSGDRTVLSGVHRGLRARGKPGPPLPGRAVVPVNGPRSAARLLPQRGDRTVALLGQVPALPAASGWTQATLRTPPAPSDATGLSTGLALSSVGSARVDDLMLGDLAVLGS